MDLMELRDISDVRHRFLIADIVLRDTLVDYARKKSDEEDLLLALRRQRMAYEGYVQMLYRTLHERRGARGSLGSHGPAVTSADDAASYGQTVVARGTPDEPLPYVPEPRALRARTRQ